MNIKIFIISLIFFLILNFLGLIDVINNNVYDNYIISNTRDAVNSDIVIVEIDTKSINNIGYWPWKRSVYCDVLKKIIDAEPKVIGINISFTKIRGKYKEDEELYNLLKSFSNIVLASKFKLINMDKITVLTPEETPFPEIKMGHALFSEDDVVRNFPAHKVLPAFSLYVLKLYYLGTNKYNYLSPELKKLLDFKNQSNYSTSTNILIDYQRTPNQFKYISFWDILNNKVSLKELKDKIVLLGVTDKYYTPIHSTPYTKEKKLFLSPMITLQAQIIDSLLNFRNLQESPFWLNLVVSLLISGLFLFFMQKKKVILQGVSFTITIIVLGIINYVLFKYYAYWFPPATVFSLIVVNFVILIYLTINTVDSQLIDTINKLHSDGSIPFDELPSDVSLKVDTLKDFIDIIATDRQTIKGIINGVHNGIIVIDNKGKILWCNKKIMELFKNTLVLDVNVTSLIKELDIESIVKSINDKENFKKEIIVGEYEFLCIINPIDQHNTKFVAIFNDITELKSVDRLKTDLVRMVSHELKTPLTGIRLNAESLYYVEDKNRITKNIDNIVKTTDLLTEIVNNFLNLSKLEANITKLNIRSNTLLPIIEKSMNLQSSFAEKRNVALVLSAEEIPEVLADADQIFIVLNNLISNAIKYSHNDGKVEIIIKNIPHAVQVSVVDNGIGIPPEDIKKVFDKFFRSSNNKNRHIEGTGLGLSIVSRIISLHNGIITLESEPGKGSNFSFTLPAAEITQDSQ